MSAGDGWMIDLVDEDLEIPGWVLVPAGTDASVQDDWVQRVLELVVELPCWDGDPLPESVAHEALRAAIDTRVASDSLAIFQIWPAMAYNTAMCHVDVVASATIPDWRRTDAAVNRVETPGLGPGLQVVTRRTVSVDDMDLDVSSVTFVFDNGDVALTVALAETVTPLATVSLANVAELAGNLRLVSTPGGDVFRAVEPAVLTADDWDLEGTG